MLQGLVDSDNNREVAIRPAFSLNLSSILFTSSASDTNGKGASSVGGSLTAMTAPTGTVKFTMKDSSMHLSVADTSDKTVRKGNPVSIDYTNATTGSSNYVSCILTDASGNVKYYGKLAQASSASGTVSIPTANLAEGTYM